MTSAAAAASAAAASLSLEPARAPRAPLSERLLRVEPCSRRLADHPVSALPSLLEPGDVVVVNDAATLPASLLLTSHAAELRLLARLDARTFEAVLFGPGDDRQRTEDRPPPPRVEVGERLVFGELQAYVAGVDERQPRLIVICFEAEGAELLQALYRTAKLVQYSYLERPLALHDVQNRFASRPWAFEMPSAGRPLTFGLIGELRARGVGVHALTHATGLSSTGSPALDRRLPRPETSDIPLATVRAVNEARARGARVLAVGTTVVRALEGRVENEGSLNAGRNETSLVIGPGFRPRVVTGIFTGLHQLGTSHFALLEAFADRALLSEALRHAARARYLEHEFGDAMLVLPVVTAGRTRV